MSRIVTHIRLLAGALALAFIVTVAAPAYAQQGNPDGSVNPTASSVKEDQLLQQLKQIQGRGTLPDAEIQHHRAARRPRLALFPRGDAAARSARSPSSACWPCWWCST